jgi:hypothetical protein
MAGLRNGQEDFSGSNLRQRKEHLCVFDLPGDRRGCAVGAGPLSLPKRRKDAWYPAALIITVVSGLPRSGTSLMMQMLAAGGLPVLTDGVRAPDQDNPRGYFEFQPVTTLRSDSTWVRDAVGKAVKVVHLLLPVLPAEFTYRVILMKRPIDPVLASQSAMLKHLGRQAAEGNRDDLKSMFAAQMAEIERFLATQPNFSRLPVEFDELFRTPIEQAQAIERFLGQPLDVVAMAAAVAPELGKRRQR